jgi:hypothetical protein
LTRSGDGTGFGAVSSHSTAGNMKRECEGEMTVLEWFRAVCCRSELRKKSRTVVPLWQIARGYCVQDIS